MDKDEQLGIQKLEYQWDTSLTADEREHIEALERYQFVVWQDDFSQSNSPNGTLKIRNIKEMKSVMFNERNIEHQVLLRAGSGANITENLFITDDYECVFLQGEFQMST